MCKIKELNVTEPLIVLCPRSVVSWRVSVLCLIFSHMMVATRFVSICDFSWQQQLSNYSPSICVPRLIWILCSVKAVIKRLLLVPHSPPRNINNYSTLPSIATPSVPFMSLTYPSLYHATSVCACRHCWRRHRRVATNWSARSRHVILTWSSRSICCKESRSSHFPTALPLIQGVTYLMRRESLIG